MEAALHKTVNRSATPRLVPAAVPMRSVPTGTVQFQSTMRVSSPRDPAEREADTTAKKIMRMAAPEVGVASGAGSGGQGDAPLSRKLESPYIARFAGSIRLMRQHTDAPTPGVGANVAAEIAQSQGAGAPLPASVRKFMEPRFGADFSKVRIHTGEKSARLNRQVSAQAFTVGNQIFFGKGQFRPDTSEGQELIAHELTHTIQQGAAAQHGAPVQRREDVTVTEQASPHVQRLGLSDALGHFANAANALPGFRMFTIILGVNPINMSRVDRSPANILRAVVEVLPGGVLITRALDNYGVFERVGTWVEQQLGTLGLSGRTIRDALDRFLAGLSLSSVLFNFSGIWEQAKSILTEPIDRIGRFARSLLGAILGFIKDAILRPIAELASQARGWDLLCAVLGTNPITGDAVPRNAETLIGGFMKLINQEEIWENIKRGNAIARAWSWFQGALSGLMGFVRQIPQRFVQAVTALEIADLVLLPQAFARVASVFGGFIGEFLKWAGNTVWDLLEIIFSVVAPNVMVYLRRAGGALRTILQNPMGFVGHLVRAGELGFRQFASRFLTHLRGSLIGWLTGALSGANIYIPQGLDLREIIKFVLSVLGLTWQNIRQKIVRVIGEPAMRALETGFELVMTLVTQGPAAAWEKIQESLSNLREMVMEQIMTFVQDRVVTAAVTRLLSMLSPAGAFIQAIIATYNTVMFFVERLRQIAQVAASFIDSIATIASGNITPAANRVEQTMAGLLTLVISFLARIAGLGRVTDAVTNVVNRVRQPIDRALDRVVEWIVTQARRLGRLAAGAASSVATRVAGWLGLRQSFQARDGQTHTVFFSGTDDAPRVMMASVQDSVGNHIAAKRRAGTTTAEESALRQAEGTLSAIYQIGRQGRQARVETESVRQRVQQLFTSLATQLQAGGVALTVQVPGGATVSVPMTHVTYTTVGPLRAGHVRANPLSARAGNTIGSGTGNSDPPGWALKRNGTLTNSNLYVRMHLLTHQRHGPGVAWNLVPAPQTFNTGPMLRGVEMPLINATAAGVVFNFSATVTYPNSTGPEKDFPTQVTVTWSVLSNPANVPVPGAPGAMDIRPLPTFGGATVATPPDLNGSSVRVLHHQGGVAWYLASAIVRARGNTGFDNFDDFRTRVDAVLTRDYRTTYRAAQNSLIENCTRLMFGTTQPTARDLSWP